MEYRVVRKNGTEDLDSYFLSRFHLKNPPSTSKLEMLDLTNSLTEFTFGNLSEEETFYPSRPRPIESTYKAPFDVSGWYR